MDFLFQPSGLGREFFRQLGQPRPVDLDAALFHAGDDRHQRPVDALVNGRTAFIG